MIPKKTLIISLLIYFFSTGISFAVFKYYLTSAPALVSPTAPTTSSTALIEVDPQAPKTEVCPLNGELYTQAEQKAWATRRPLLIMIENHLEARPQSGLSTADVVYETIAEGGITRFMAAFYCDAITQDNTIGPVRSARTYFLDWASEYSNHPLYAHVGGANVPGPADALGQINKYDWGHENDLNQFALTVKECWRDYSRLGRQVATEHTMYCSTEALWKVGASRGWAATGEDNKDWSSQFTSWQFADPQAVSSPSAIDITFDFWDKFSQYTVNWKYDPGLNSYARSNGGDIHQDNNSQQQLQARVVIIQYVKETGPIDDHKHMLYATTGTGKALVFQNGEVIKATWSKKDRTSRTIFKDSAGKEIKFARGKLWIEAVPSDATINY